MDQYAGIGSRGLGPREITLCELAGRAIVRSGNELHSGNAEGADQAFQRGGNSVDPSLVHVHLPWYNFNREALHPDNVIHNLDECDEDTLRAYERLAEKYHPRWTYLKRGVRTLMRRNSSILYPNYPHPVEAVLAWPSNKPGGGGTGQGIRIAQGEGIPLILLGQSSRAELDRFIQNLRTK